MGKENRTIKTALDSLPYGDRATQNFEGRIRKKIPFPSGVDSAMLRRDILFIAAPSLVELILSQLTSMADQIMVGRLPGAAGVMALSAVGLAAQPKFILMTMIQAMNVGSTAVIARFRGQQNRQKANQAFKQAIILNLLLSAVFMILGIVFAEPLIQFMGGNGIQDATLQQAVEYLKIQMYGFVPLAISFTITATLRGIGDTKIPMLYNTVANVVNLVMNYVMIYGHFGFPAMGVTGASIATVIGQLVAFIIAVFFVLNKQHYIFFDFKEKIVFDRSIMKAVINIGTPSMIEQMFMRIGSVIFTRTVAGLGDTLYATQIVCTNIQTMTFMLGQAVSNSTTALFSQSLGKYRYDMAELYMKEARKIGFVISSVLAIILALFGKYIVAVYNSTPEIIDIGGKVLLFIAIIQPIQSAQFIVSGGLRGAGDTRYAAGVIAFTVVGIRALLGLLFINVFDLGIWGAWAAIATDQVVRSCLMILRYSSGKWKKIATRTTDAIIDK